MKIKMTKVICTIGPKSESSEMLQKLVQNGMNIMRLNFSHGDYEEHGGRIDRLREITDNTGRYIGILLDTKGPEIRTGKLEGGNDVLLEAGNKITITTDYSHVGNKDKISVSYPGIVNDLKPGNTILLDDGLIGLEVLEIKDNEIFCEIKNTGELGEIKGVNLPGVSVGLPALAEKDIADLKFGCEKGVDFVAASFIRKASDVAEVRRVLDENGGARIQIISKIENQEGVDNFDEILELSDAIMVARGDLGVEIPAEEVPLIQKELVRKAKSHHIPVIIATQMMESMISSLTPTRAEVNDVGNSVLDGADAVMLSGETSVGKYPVQVIQQMSRIIKSVEDSDLIQVPLETPFIRSLRYVTNTICFHAAKMANDTNAKVITSLTNSGYAAFRISSYRPNSHILIFTSNRRLLTQLNLLWGVTTFYYDRFVSTDELIEDINHIANEKGYVDMGDIMISLVSMPMQGKGMVNTLRVSEIDSCAVNFEKKKKK